MKQAVILAGGKGTRLQERLQGLPKPLIDICGKPLLERQIELLKSYGFEQILILVNHGAQQILDFCQSRDQWNIDVQCIDDGTPLGTAGAVIKTFPLLADDFLVVYGDTMFDIDLARFQAFHEQDPSAGATLFLHPNDHPQDSDLVGMDESNRISAFYPYPHPPGTYLPNLVNAGMYYFRKSALQAWAGNKQLLDFGKHIFPVLIDQGVVLRGYNSPEYIKDCGTPARLDKVSTQYESGLIAGANLRFKQKLVFLDRDGTINHLVDHLSKLEDFELLPGVAKAISALNKSGYRTVLVTNQPVIARGDCTPEELEQIHCKMQTLLGQEGAYLDRIYFCPHHPDKGFANEVPELKIACQCRKPAIGMLEQAKADLNADFSASWMIGDSTADLLAAHTAGVHSILLETGAAGLDEKYAVLPDFIAPNLPVAVDFILHHYPRLLQRCETLAQEIVSGEMVFVGGPSRTGKSTLAHCLQDALKQQGKSSVILSLDGWLKPASERGSNVLERYDLPAILALINILMGRTAERALTVPIYSKIDSNTDAQKKRVVEKIIGSKDVVILEGTIALHLAELAKLERVSNTNSHLYYVTMDEALRKARVLAEYALRGKSSVEAEQIYAQRLHDEIPYLEADKPIANHIIDLELQ
jgi:histidinol-phosphate phosphatase family protein